MMLHLGEGGGALGGAFPKRYEDTKWYYSVLHMTEDQLSVRVHDGGHERLPDTRNDHFLSQQTYPNV